MASDDEHQPGNEPTEAFADGRPMGTDDSPTTSMSSLEQRRSLGIVKGLILGDRYRLVRRLGRGGMGEVWEAEDITLGGRVALKTILSGLDVSADTIRRFKREVHVARKVTHPNVCRIHDLGIHHLGGGSDVMLFLTMELIRGATLREDILRRGRYDPDHALPIVEQIAAALDAAHAAGVIHRDLKSANVMIVPSAERGGQDRAVVTDFGLARSQGNDDATLSSISRPHAVVGTPAYMAPEQIQGAEPTVAVDVYAFGVLLYEMVTGARPFSGGTPMSEAARRLVEPPPPPTTVVPDLDPTWEAVILQCLEISPGDRFATAGDAVRALKGDQPPPPQTSPGEEIDEATHLDPPRRRRRRWAVPIVALVAALIAVGAWLVWRQFPPAQPSTTVSADQIRPVVAVLPPGNLVGDPEAEWLSTAIAELLTTELGVGQGLRMVGGAEVAGVAAGLAARDVEPSEANLTAAVHEQLGADFVVAGSYSRVGEGDETMVRVDLRVVDPQDGSLITQDGATGSPTQLFELLGRASDGLREAVGLGALSPSEALEVRATWPEDPDAARFFATGVERARRFDLAGARVAFENAVEEEPEHPLIHAELSRVLRALGDRKAALEQIERALQSETELPATVRKTMEADALVLQGDATSAARVYRQLFERHPDDLRIGLRLAAVLNDAAQPLDARAVLDTLRALPPPAGRDPRIDLIAADVLASQGHFDESLEATRRAVKGADESGSAVLAAVARLRAGEQSIVAGDHSGAESLLNDARTRFERINDRLGATECLEALGSSALTRGDLSTAERLFSDALEDYESLGHPLAAARVTRELADVALVLGDLDRAARLLDDATRRFADLGAEKELAAALLNHGVELHLRGEIVKAEELYLRAMETFTEQGDRANLAVCLTNLGEIAFLRGKVQRAKSLHEESLALSTENGDVSGIAYDTYRLGMVLMEMDDREIARRRLEEALNLQTELGERFSEAQTRNELSRLDLAEGDLEAARQHARAAEQEFRNQGADELAAIASCQLASIDIADDDTEGAAALLDGVRESVGEDPGLDLRAAVALVAARLAERDPQPDRVDSVAAELETTAAAMEKAGLVLGRLELDVEHARLLSRVDRNREAVALARQARSEASELGLRRLEAQAAVLIDALPAD